MNRMHPAAARGFTLIELLVVVLIVGILAAIALPQYFYMVKATRAKSKITALRPVLDAQKTFWLANGASTQDITLLDVSIPYNSFTDVNANQREYFTDWGSFILGKGATEGGIGVGVSIKIGDLNMRIYNPAWYYASADKAFYGICNSTTEEGEKICSKMGPLGYTSGGVNVYAIDF